MPSFDRAALLGILYRTLDALHGDRDLGDMLAPSVRITENGAGEASGFWKTARPGGYRLVFADVSRSEVGCHATFTENDLVGIYGLRLKVGEGGRIAEVESLVARKGDATAFAPHRLATPAAAFDRVEPEATRLDRAGLIAAANAYFDAIEKSDGRDAPIADACDRVENGLRTTNNPEAGMPLKCREGIKIFGYLERVRDRRYSLVDEARGIVWAAAALEVPKGAVMRRVVDGNVVERPQVERSIFLSELFKISNGEIVAIDAVVRNMPKGSAFGFSA